MASNLITSKDNKQIKFVHKLFLDSKYRNSSNCFVAESVRVVNAFINQGFNLKALIINHQSKFLNQYKKYEELITLVNQEVYHHLSQLQNGDGIIGVFSFKKQTVNDNAQKIIVLDSIQDPNNLGAILRSAKAFNVDQIYLVNNCVDLFNFKVIKASMGYGYDIPIKHETNLEYLINKLKQNKIKVYATGINKQAKSIKVVDFNHPTAIIFGNEGNGLKKQVFDLVDQTIFIPINSAVDSLNLAIAVSVILSQM
ncbi:MAG: RNA methyltransferase [Mycoplasma sp.]